MSQKAIYDYGKIFLDDVKSTRRYFEIKDINEQNIINDISYHTSVDLSNYTYKIIKRETGIGFSMKWHIDDVALIKISKNELYKENDQILNQKYLLYHKDELPIYTAIIYLSEYQTDFAGGEFEFIDEQIKPKKNYVLFFDSREVHRVLPVKKGTRQNILIKFYKKII